MRVLDLDLQGYLANIRHDVLLSQVARRVRDPEVLRVLKLILKAAGKRGAVKALVSGPGGILMEDTQQDLRPPYPLLEFFSGPEERRLP